MQKYSGTALENDLQKSNENNLKTPKENNHPN